MTKWMSGIALTLALIGGGINAAQACDCEKNASCKAKHSTACKGKTGDALKDCKANDHASCDKGMKGCDGTSCKEHAKADHAG